MNAWTDLATWQGSTDQVQMPDSGWQQLIAWLVAESVSPDLVTIGPQPEAGPVREDCTDSAGVTTTSYREFTAEDRAAVDEGNNEYLIDAGVPPLPPGTGVYLTLPDGVPDMDEFCAVLNAELGDRNLSHPRESAAALREVIPRHYA